MILIPSKTYEGLSADQNFSSIIVSPKNPDDAKEVENIVKRVIAFKGGYDPTDEEFLKIKEISCNIESEILLLFWQFSIRTLEELNLVSNQNLTIEMFLMRLIYLSSNKSNTDEITNTEQSNKTKKILV